MLNFALLGCGNIARRHANLLGNDLIAGARLAAVCDLDEETASRLGKKFNVPYYSNLDQMMAQEEIDAVSVLTPSGAHAASVIDVSRFGKSIIVEKPMALTLDDADAMIRACDVSGSRLFVVKQNRFNVPVVKLREALEAGRFGKLVMGTVRVRWCRTQEYYDQHPWRGTWAHDGGVLANQASHHVDLLEWMMGDVVSVFAYSATSLVDIETEDTATVILKFRNGALGIIEATTATRPKDLEGSLSILGETGSVEIGGFAVNEMKTWNFSNADPVDDEILKNFCANPKHEFGYAHQAYYEHIVDCIANDKQQLVDGLEGRRSLELISAIYESIETGKQVTLRFAPKECRLGIA